MPVRRLQYATRPPCGNALVSQQLAFFDAAVVGREGRPVGSLIYMDESDGSEAAVTPLLELRTSRSLITRPGVRRGAWREMGKSALSSNRTF